MHPIILPKISRVFTLPPDTTYFYILVSAASPFLAKMRAERFMRRKTYGVRHIYATTAKRINLRSWEVEVVVIKSSPQSRPNQLSLTRGVEIPYGSASMVGERTSFLREILPGWEWERWLLTSPNKKITIHAHFTEISEDLIPYKDEIMEAMKSIRSVFLSIPVRMYLAGTALEPFKEKAKPYADVLNRHGL